MTRHPAQILVAYDFSAPSELALKHALNLALDEAGKDFHFLVVLDPHKGIGLEKGRKVDFQYAEEVQAMATARIESAIAELKRGGEISMLVHVHIGSPVEEILAVAQEVGASLILVGSHGRTGAKRVFLGSVSEHVVREALCPVLVTRDRGYVDVSRSKMIEVPRAPDTYVPPQRYHHKSGFPTRDKAWALY